MNALTWLSRRRFPYEPLITVEISKSRILHNLSEFKKLAPHGKVAPVLKSNAYGHGLMEVAHILGHEKDIPFFIVDSYFEAVALRSKGFKHPLLIIGYTRPSTIIRSRLRNVAFTITSLEMLREIEEMERRVEIHLKIDTGMHRQGILPEEIDMAITMLSENTYIKLEGLCSHLSDADNADISWTEGQISVWNKTVKRFRESFPLIKHIHLSATDGHRFTQDIDANVSRLGIGLYGLTDNFAPIPSGVKGIFPKIDLKPALKMKTIITGIKHLKRDQTVGYGNTFKAEREMVIATIPVGYYEGVDRRLSNKGFLLVGTDHVACQIVGRVSMNITTLDISHHMGNKVGMPVTVISDSASAPNSIQSMAKVCDTISYDIVVKIPAQLKRTIVD